MTTVQFAAWSIMALIVPNFARAAPDASTERFMALLVAVPNHELDHYGLVRRSPNESDAAMIVRAFDLCGDTNCKLVQAWYRGACLAVARGVKSLYWSGEDFHTAVDATRRVWNSCKQRDQECVLVYNGCL